MAIGTHALKAGADQTATVTLKDGTEGVKDADVSVTWSCGADNEKAWTGKTGDDGSAEASVTLDTALADGDKCDITASHTPEGGTAITDEKKDVTLGDAAGNNLQGYTLAITAPAAGDQSAAFAVTVQATESGSGDTKIATDSVEVTIEKACVADAATPVDADWEAHGDHKGNLMAKDASDTGSHHFAVNIADVAALTDPGSKPDCHIRACASVKVNTAGDALEKDCSAPVQVLGN